MSSYKFPSKALKDPNLSLDAKGLLIFLLEQPSDWNFSIFQIADQNKDSSLGGILNALLELHDNDYINLDSKNFLKINTGE